jgi:hypothetical protein
MSRLSGNQKATPTELLMTAGFALLCLLGTAISFAASYYIASFIIGLFAVLSAWSFIESLGAGRREATSFEKFEQRLFVRAIATVFCGGALVYAVWRFVDLESKNMKAALLLSALAIWLGAVFYTVRKLRGRQESAAAYKRRIKYIEKE